jgi:hypothetical protein
MDFVNLNLSNKVEVLLKKIYLILNQKFSSIEI